MMSTDEARDRVERPLLARLLRNKAERERARGNVEAPAASEPGVKNDQCTVCWYAAHDGRECDQRDRYWTCGCGALRRD